MFSLCHYGVLLVDGWETTNNLIHSESRLRHNNMCNQPFYSFLMTQFIVPFVSAERNWNVCFIFRFKITNWPTVVQISEFLPFFFPLRSMHHLCLSLCDILSNLSRLRAEHVVIYYNDQNPLHLFFPALHTDRMREARTQHRLRDRDR